MPIYEYQCESCGYRLETIQRMSDDPLTDCPECEEPQLKKLISAVAFRLKGSGWYETDFKKANQKNLAKSDDSKPKSASKKGSEKATSTKKSDTTKSSKAS